MTRIMRSFSRLRARVRQNGEGGFTLAEVLVVMLVLGILTAAVATLMRAGMGTSTVASQQLNETNAARTGMESVTRVLRTAVLPSQLQAACAGCDTAYAFLSGTPTSMTFYANIDNPDNAYGPSRVSFAVDANGNLVMTTQKPDSHGPTDFNYKWTPCTAGQPGCLKQERVIADGVPTSAPLFTYYDANGNVIATPISGSQLGTVAAVDVYLTVKHTGYKDPAPITFVNRVALPNADSVVKADESP